LRGLLLRGGRGKREEREREGEEKRRGREREKGGKRRGQPPPRNILA